MGVLIRKRGISKRVFKKIKKYKKGGYRDIGFSDTVWEFTGENANTITITITVTVRYGIGFESIGYRF